MKLIEYLEIADTVDDEDDMVLKFQIKAYKKLAKKWWLKYHESAYMKPTKALMYEKKVMDLEKKLEARHG